MITEDITLEQRITEMESAVAIADEHSDFLFAKQLREHLAWLKSIQARQEHTVC